jgi:hypothetical protein
MQPCEQNFIKVRDFLTSEVEQGAYGRCGQNEMVV